MLNTISITYLAVMVLIFDILSYINSPWKRFSISLVCLLLLVGIRCVTTTLPESHEAGGSSQCWYYKYRLSTQIGAKSQNHHRGGYGVLRGQRRVRVNEQSEQQSSLIK